MRALRVLFDTTVLWGAFFNPTGPNFRLLALAAQRAPGLDGFFTDAVAAEFWWRATQQGVKGSGSSVTRTYSDAELTPFLEAFETLLEPEQLAQAPLSRSLGRYSGLVGRPLGEALHAITGRDRDALLSGATMQFPMNFESVDIADLHVIAGAIDNHADVLCSADRRTLSYDPIGTLRVMGPRELARDFGLVADAVSAPTVRPPADA